MCIKKAARLVVFSRFDFNNVDITNFLLMFWFDRVRKHIFNSIFKLHIYVQNVKKNKKKQQINSNTNIRQRLNTVYKKM